MQQPSSGIIDINQQAAFGSSSFKPVMISAINLDQFTEAITVIAWLVWTFHYFGSRNPEPIGRHPAPNCYYRDIQVKHAAELLMGQGRSKSQQMFRNNGKTF
jgi:hypothetical protein